MIVVAVSGNDAVAASLPGVCRCVTQSGFAGIGMGNVLDVALQVGTRQIFCAHG